ncbi:MAG: hypothetical protein HWQ35_22770 [Nostoc sp. NMS1]|uniref:hypothetical protein n=1 Tax=unclassified Nostoc TaxID=2593658 RepID=UPI0025D1E1C7|nr:MULTISPECIES: hypothetical protein [unclassified Nostoc]MBN3909276.1 hypothetical protein [Nostoc sp. NMS1]MBN3993360.1 hypothetical protein [Nostoc sp. NMS2]
MDSVIIYAHSLQAIFDTFSFSAICYPSMGILNYFLRINLKDQNTSRILPESDNGLKASSSLHIAHRLGQFAGSNMKQNARIYKAIYENTLTQCRYAQV